MSHFKHIASNEIVSGPVDYSAPVGETTTYLCSSTVKSALNQAKPAGHKFTANAGHNEKWLRKFEEHTDNYPDFVQFGKGKSGLWYAKAVYL